MLAISIASFALLISILSFADRLATHAFTNEQSDIRAIDLAESRRKLGRCIYKFGYRLLLTAPIWAVFISRYASSESISGVLDNTGPVMRLLVVVSALVPVWFAVRFTWHLRDIAWDLRGKHETRPASFIWPRIHTRANWGDHE